MPTWIATGLTDEETAAMSDREWQDFLMSKIIDLPLGRQGIKPSRPRIGDMYLDDDGWFYVWASAPAMKWVVIGKGKAKP